MYLQLKLLKKIPYFTSTYFKHKTKNYSANQQIKVHCRYTVSDMKSHLRKINKCILKSHFRIKNKFKYKQHAEHLQKKSRTL